MKVKVDNGGRMSVKGLIHRKAYYSERFPIKDKFFSVLISANKEAPFGSANYSVNAYATSPLLSDDPNVRRLHEPSQPPAPDDGFVIEGQLQTVVARLIDRGNNELVDKVMLVASAIRDRVSPVGRTEHCL